MNIDVSKIKPGDTVRVSFPVEYAGVVQPNGSVEYEDDGIVYLEADDVTVLEHVPARPDWADALVVQDGDGDFWGHDAGVVWMRLSNAGQQIELAVADHLVGPVTVVLDGDGNPPHPQACAERVAELQEQLHAVARERDEALSSNEPVWLDGDALDGLPVGSVVLQKEKSRRAWIKVLGGWWRATESPTGSGLGPAIIAPARVLYTPEAAR